MKYSTSKLLITIVLIIWSFTLLRSITIMIGGKKIFIKASRGEKSCLYPIINLFSMLEIVDMSTYFGVLFFVPVLNYLLLTVMSWKLGKVFKTGLFFKLGLVVLPILFYPILGSSKRVYKVRDVSFFKAISNQRAEDIDLTIKDDKKTEVEEEEEDNVKVDSIFKSNVQVMEQVAPYKAAKIDIYGMEKIKSAENEAPATETKSEEGNKNIETIDL